MVGKIIEWLDSMQGLTTKMVSESLAHEVDMQVRSFRLDLLIRILDLFVYITQLHECTNLCLLHSDVVNYFLVQGVPYLINLCSNVIIFWIKTIYVMFKLQIL